MANRIPPWAARMFPELILFDSDEAQAKAWRTATSSVMREWRYWAMLVLGIAGIVLFVGLLGKPLVSAIGGIIPMPPVIASGVLGGVIGGAIGGGGIVIFRRTIAKSLRRQLVDVGIPVCFGCGYSLHTTIEPRCPECGREFDPQSFTNTGEKNADDPSA